MSKFGKDFGHLCFFPVKTKISTNGLKMQRKSCMDWHVPTDLKHNFIFPTEIALVIKSPDIVIWSVKAKKVFVIELMVPLEENFDWAYQCKLEKI